MKHTNGEKCLRCNEFLKLADPVMVAWFSWVRSIHSDAHVYSSYRGEGEQNKLVAEGKSKKYWPLSPHNKVDENGNPKAEALDLFQLLPNGAASFSPLWYEDIWEETKKANLPIRWGGDFATLRDYNHFEMRKV